MVPCQWTLVLVAAAHTHAATQSDAFEAHSKAHSFDGEPAQCLEWARKGVCIETDVRKDCANTCASVRDDCKAKAYSGFCWDDGWKAMYMRQHCATSCPTYRERALTHALQWWAWFKQWRERAWVGLLRTVGFSLTMGGSLVVALCLGCVLLCQLQIRFQKSHRRSKHRMCQSWRLSVLALLGLVAWQATWIAAQSATLLDQHNDQQRQQQQQRRQKQGQQRRQQQQQHREQHGEQRNEKQRARCTRHASVRDYYAILKISPDTTAKEVKKAYHKMALSWHPDRNVASGQEARFAKAERNFKLIARAYEILSDERTRAAYDCGENVDAPGWRAPG